MSLSEAFESAAGKYRAGYTCTMSEQIGDLPKEDQVAIWAAIDDERRFSLALIAKVLRDNGIDLSVGTIRRHRRSECVTCGSSPRTPR